MRLIGACQIQRASCNLRKIAAATILVLGSSLMLNHSGNAKGSIEVAHRNVGAMLEEINKIYSKRDIKLDCSDYVERYLGRNDSIKHYIDQFEAFGIKPIRKYLVPKHFTYFEIGYQKLKDVVNSKFKKGDVVVVSFTTEDEGDDSKIVSCGAILKAAPNLP